MVKMLRHLNFRNIKVKYDEWLNKKPTLVRLYLDDDIVLGVLVFFFAYILIFISAVLIVSIDGKDITTTLSSVAATIGNIGPGLGMVGAMGNYANYSVLSKIVLSICMIIGRLEIFPMLLLLFSSFWKKVNI